MQEDAGVRLQFIVAIEGYPYLLTDGDASAAVTAWAASGDWTQALSGLFLNLNYRQRIDPWSSEIDVGSFSFSVMDCTGDDTLGKTVFATTAGTESQLRAAVDCNDTTIPAKQTSTFDASGSAYMGVECFGYSSVTGGATPTFNTAVRGKWAPFKAGSESSGATRFGRPHTRSFTGYNISRYPEVTSTPKAWAGRWVGVWAHRNVDGVLDLKAQAELIMSGVVTSVRDSADGTTLFQCDDLKSAIGNTVLMRDQYKARVKPGVFIATDQRFRFRDRYYSAGWNSKTANDLVVVASGASGANQINAGIYTHDEIYEFLNIWLASEKAASRLYGAHEFGQNETYNTIVTGYISAAGASENVDRTMHGPRLAAQLLGLNTGTTLSDGGVDYSSDASWFIGAAIGKSIKFTSEKPILKYAVGFGVSQGDHGYNQLAYETVTVEESGTIIGSKDYLPPEIVKEDSPSVGLAVLDDKSVRFVRRISATELRVYPPDWRIERLFDTGATVSAIETGLQVRIDERREITFSQLLFMRGSFRELLTQILASTGTTGYNSATYDVLQGHISAGIPWDLLGDEFVASAGALDASETKALTVICDKPTKLNDIIGVELLLRRASFQIKYGKLILKQWTIPKSRTSVFDLSEATKASPNGVSDRQVSVTEYTDANLINLVKIEYGRRLDGSYSRTVAIRDDASIDEVGQTKSVTISARNALVASDDDLEAVEKLIGTIGSWIPLFSKPMMIIRVPINQTLFSAVSPGDIVSITDSFVREPSTGARGVSSMVGLVISHSFDWGGREPGGSVRPQGGEVDVAVYPRIRIADYSPAGEIDDTYTTGTFTDGYSSSTTQIRLKDHAFTLTTDGVDASYFLANDEVTIYEIDPLTPGSPRSWNRTVTVVSGSTITLSSALTGFSSSELYRIESRAYGSAVSSQKLLAYQADDADGRVVDTRLSYHWDGGTDATNVDPVDLSEMPEHPSGGYGDGFPMEPSRDVASCRVLNNVMSYKSKVAAPVHFCNDAAAATSGSWKLMAVFPFFTHRVGYASTPTITVAPIARVDTAAGTLKLRVTVSPSLPRSTAASYVSSPIVDNFREPYWQTDWSQARGVTAYIDLDAQQITLDGLSSTPQLLWCIIEGDNARLYGLSRFEFDGGL